MKPKGERQESCIIAIQQAYSMRITEEQRSLNQKLHEKDTNYGNRYDGAGIATNITKAISRMNELGACSSILDYGTGKGKLVERMRNELKEEIIVDGYDPAVEKWEKFPKRKYDLLTCLDVLEHIELDSIDNVLDDIKNLTENFAFIVIDLQPAVKTLNDGRNAHILLAPSDWWIGKLSQRFSCVAAFPVMHMRGLAQKLVIGVSNKRTQLTLMYSFLIKLNIFDYTMNGGPLGTYKKIKK